MPVYKVDEANSVNFLDRTLLLALNQCDIHFNLVGE